MPGFRAATVSVGDVTIYIVMGPKRESNLLLIPGLNEPWTSYLEVLPMLSQEYSVFVCDLRGHGLTGKPAEPAYSVLDYTRDVVGMIKSVIGSRTAVAGNSLGALIAARVAAEQPDLVDSVILEDGPFFITEWPRWRHEELRKRLFKDPERILRWRDHKKRSEGNLVRQLARRRWAFTPGTYPSRVRFIEKMMRLLEPLWPSLSDEQRSRLQSGHARFLLGRRVVFSDMLPQSFIDAMALKYAHLTHGCVQAAMSSVFNAGYDHALTLNRIRCPVLVLEADRDLVGLLTPSDMSRMLRELSGAPVTHQYVDGALHEIHQSHPEIYVKALLDFLGAIRTAA